MAVTGKEIAKRLGLSTATVSLALNNRPGVNERTRKAVLTCRNAMQRERDGAHARKVLLLNDQELSSVNDYGLFEQSYAELFQVLNAHGCLLQLQVYENDPQRFRSQLEQLKDGIAGIIVFAVNLPPDCVRALSRISAPVVIFDSDIFIPGADNFLIDNAGGIAAAMELFERMGRKEIYYLAHADRGNFNFLDRRRAVRELSEQSGISVHTLTLGRTIEEICRNAIPFLQAREGQQINMLMENYQVSLGVLRAAQQLQTLGKRHIPEELLPVCFDELPKPALSLIPWRTPMIRIPHRQKANMAAIRLIERMEGKAEQEFTFTVRTQLLNGEF